MRVGQDKKNEIKIQFLVHSRSDLVSVDKTVWPEMSNVPIRNSNSKFESTLHISSLSLSSIFLKVARFK